jgi:hypothetical protein
MLLLYAIIDKLKQEQKDSQALDGFLNQSVVVDAKVCVKWIMCSLLSEKI